MGLDASLSWLALALTPGLASRLSGRLPEEFGGAGGGVSGAVAAVGAVGAVPVAYELLNSDEAVHIDDIVERSGLNSSEVLATLFDLEMKGIVRQMPGKPFHRVLL